MGYRGEDHDERMRDAFMTSFNCDGVLKRAQMSLVKVEAETGLRVQLIEIEFH